jgi:meiotically up-regulated gene 157 (Mug157) protein
MDDANLPSLLAAPYYGFCDRNDPLYLSTRSFVLSPKTPITTAEKPSPASEVPIRRRIRLAYPRWPLQGLTADDPAEKLRLLRAMMDTDAGCGQMHESFDPNDPAKFTRPWFAWQTRCSAC